MWRPVAWTSPSLKQSSTLTSRPTPQIASAETGRPLANVVSIVVCLLINNFGLWYSINALGVGGREQQGLARFGGLFDDGGNVVKKKPMSSMRSASSSTRVFSASRFKYSRCKWYIPLFRMGSRPQRRSFRRGSERNYYFVIMTKLWEIGRR